MRLKTAFRLLSGTVKPKYKELRRLVKSDSKRRFLLGLIIVGGQPMSYYPLRFNQHHNKNKPFPICRKCWMYYGSNCQPKNRNECDQFMQGR